jgi:hypothetical protein
MALLLGGLSSSLWAQSVTTSAISGRITDQRGEPLPGANVVAVHLPTGTQYGTSTRADGRYNLVNLRPGGPYTVTVSFVGYRTERREGLYLPLGETMILDFELTEQAIQAGEVVVTAERNAILSSARTGAATQITFEQLRALPTIARSLTDFTRLTPQVVGNSIAGRNNRFNNIQVDGAVLNDAFGLAASGTPGGQAGTEPISLDAIEELQVAVSPYDVRQNGFTGGLINAITRSGTNRYQGSVYFYGRNQDFVGGGPAQVPIGDFRQFESGFRIGGPVQTNRFFFFLSGEMGRRDLPQRVVFRGQQGAVVFDVPEADVARFYNILKTKYGYEAGGYGSYTWRRNSDKLFLRLDYNLAPGNRITIRHNFVNALDDNLSRGATTYQLRNTNYVFRSQQNSTVAQWTATFGNQAASELRLAYTRIRDRRDPDGDPFPMVEVAYGSARLVAGTERFSGANELDQDIVELTYNFSYFTGPHTITIGSSNQFFAFRNLFIRDFYGYWFFNSLNDFEAGRAARYEHSYSVTGNPRESARPRMWQLGFYAQDEWRLLPDLRLTFGLRLDVPVFTSKPSYNPDVEAVFGLRTDKVPSGNVLWSPRFGFNFDLSRGRRTTQIRGGTGVFSGRIPFVWISNQYSNTGMEFKRLNITRNVPQFVPDPFNQPKPGVTPGISPIPTTEINITDPNFRFPQVWRTNLAFDQQLPFLGFVFTAEGIYSRGINDIVYKDLNLVGPQGKDPVDGRPVFGPRTGSRFGSPVVRDSRFTNVIYMGNISKGYEYLVTLSLERPPQQGFFGKLAYTFGDAFSVNDLTSSQAISQWRFNEVPGDPNNPPLARSDFAVRNRLIATLSYRFDFGRFIGRRGWATTISLFHESRQGSPYSFIYDGDVNVDGQGSNDLIYVPRDASEIILTTNNWNELNEFIENDPYLRKMRGKIVEKNAILGPWSHQVDLRITQEIPTLGGQRLEVTLDVLNVTNLLNKDWGVVKFVPFGTYQLLRLSGIDPATGKYRFAFTKPESIFQISDLASRWQMQLGIRYTF